MTTAATATSLQRLFARRWALTTSTYLLAGTVFLRVLNGILVTVLPDASLSEIGVLGCLVAIVGLLTYHQMRLISSVVSHPYAWAGSTFLGMAAGSLLVWFDPRLSLLAIGTMVVAQGWLLRRWQWIVFQVVGVIASIVSAILGTFITEFVWVRLQPVTFRDSFSDTAFFGGWICAVLTYSWISGWCLAYLLRESIHHQHNRSG